MRFFSRFAFFLSVALSVLFVIYPQHSFAAPDDWTVTMIRWDSAAGVMPRVGTINAGEKVNIKYTLERSPRDSGGLLFDVTCVISNNTGGSRVFSGTPNAINTQLRNEIFDYFPNQDTEYSFRCAKTIDSTDYGESLPPISITVRGGID